MDKPADQLVLDVQDLTKHFGSKPALTGVTFQVERGKIFGFLGPNGAGKTTTIRCLMDYIRPSGGDIKVFGKNPHDAGADLKRDIGYLSSDLQLYDNWTGREHLALVEGVRGKHAGSGKLAEELELDLSRRVKQLSSGNKQKLAITLAFAGRPKLLIMDEPTRGLDPLLQNQLFDLLKAFAAGGGTVFFSSHYLDEVQRICDGVVIIRAGKVVAERSMSGLRDLQLHLIEATFTHPVPAGLFREVGVTVTRHSGTQLSLRVHGNLNPIVHQLGQLKLKDLQIRHADLEEIFMEYYQ
jgi:ABC-2 type transport system ATP-binding protein